MKKLLLVDGNSVLFRAYYATSYGKQMTSSSGAPTNAVFGFANMLQKAIDLVQPDAVFVAFDAGKHTFRHELYADYKGGRKPAPDDLVPQFQLVRDYLDGFHIKWYETPDIEADDIIGTLSLQSKDYETTILSSDHDLLQLIDSTTRVMLMKKGLTEMEIMTPEALKETMGIIPSQIIDLKALMGDTSDNIPGIKGVGEKTALKLLAEYDTVENVLAHDQEIKGALGAKIQGGHESALMSKTLATIKRDVNLDFTAEDCAFEPNYETLIRFFQSVDMNSLIRKYEPYLNATTSLEEHKEETVETFEIVKKLPKDFASDTIYLYIDANLLNAYEAEIMGFGLKSGSRGYYITLEDAQKDTHFLQVLAQETPRKVGFDVKRNLHLLERNGLTISFQDDAMIMAALVDSTLTSPEKIFAKFGIMDSLSLEDVYGKENRPKLPELNERVSLSTRFAGAIETIYTQCLSQIQEEKLENLYYHIEMPLTFILYGMEKEGVICDKKVLEEIASDMKSQMEHCSEQIYALAGMEFNLNSPKQLSEVLFDHLGLPSGKKRSTSADVLEKLAGVHEIIPLILQYRKIQKIFSTYADGLQKYIQKDGKIHTIFNQCVTQTGRLSSSEPNLQNISVRDEQGKVIRKAFLPSEGHLLVSSDYHQVELRILAHMAKEKNMIEAFQSGIDIHTSIAMKIFGIENEGDVTSEMRRQAKTVNFGIVYGISDFGLAEQLGISRKEASEFIASYYKSFPNIQSYMNQVVADCERDGYVTTLCGRRREIPEIKDKNRMVREFGKRAAMNAPIQGTAADLIKLAMIQIDERMKQSNVKSKMILQVHDELIFDVVIEELEQMKQIIEEGMIHAMELDVPLTVECSTGKNWYEAK